MNHDETIRCADELGAAATLLFAGREPELVGAVLVELAAILVAGYHPDLREGTLRLFMSTVRDLVPVVEHEMGDPWSVDK
jgi:hypothetical protein